MRKAIATTALALAAIVGASGIAHASQAKPSPDSSCSKVNTRATYYTPVRHQRDLLRCELVGTHHIWKIVGH